MNKLIITSMLLLLSFGCGGSAPKTATLKSQNDVVSQNIDIMDLRSSVIILQSEIIELKENLNLADALNQSLQNKIIDRDTRLSMLENYPNTGNSVKPTAKIRTEINTGNIEDSYNTALTYYFDSDYEESIKSFEQMINIDDSHELSDNAQYWIGESYFGLGNYAQALGAFEVVLTYPQSNKNDYAQFKIGLCLLKLKKEPQAYAAFQSFIESYPESELFSRVVVLRDGIQ